MTGKPQEFKFPRILTLTEDEKNKARVIGTARCDAKSPSVRKTNSGYHEDEEDRAYPHHLGVAAEIVYASISGKPLDERIMPGGDHVDFEGLEIKASTWPKPDIELKVKISDYKTKFPQCYLLARVPRDLAYVEFMGCVSRDRFEKEKYEKTHRADNYCMEAKDLDKYIPILNQGIWYLYPIGE